MNVSTLWEKAVKMNPDKAAIIYPPENRKYSFREVDRRAARAANVLVCLGLKKGDRVGIYARNHPEWWTTYLGILKAGGIMVPINFMLKGMEIQHIAANSELRFLFSEQDLMGYINEIRSSLPNLEKIVLLKGADEGAVSLDDLAGNASDLFETVDCKPDDTASIIYTSGTTGTPKGAMLTHGNLTWAISNLASKPLRLDSTDTWIQVVPLAHVSGQMWGMSALCSGATLIRLDRFDVNNYCRVVKEYKVTSSDGVVTIVQSLLNYPEAPKHLGSLRRVADGGAPMPPDAFKEFESRFGIKIVDFYGLTETSLLAVYLPMDVPRRRGACGFAAPDTEIKIFDENDNELSPGEVGEVVVKGPQVMKGYWMNPEATAEALRGGWFHTGDLGKLDTDGYLYIVDRKKDIILMSGWSIFPREVEDVIRTHPDVLEAAVIAVPHKLKGEIPIAVVSLKSGSQLTDAELISFCKERLAVYKYPRAVEFVEEFPRVGGGWKILKRDLQAKLGPKYLHIDDK